MHACPVDAIVINLMTDAKDVVLDKCVGCKVCTIACPFGTVNYNQATGKVAKCDLCGGNPQCVAACPTNAITFIDADATGLDRMRASAAKSLSGAAVA
jgi:Fe-S-cluster-containing hydrogenase component 2